MTARTHVLTSIQNLTIVRQQGFCAGDVVVQFAKDDFLGADEQLIDTVTARVKLSIDEDETFRSMQDRIRREAVRLLHSALAQLDEAATTK